MRGRLSRLVAQYLAPKLYAASLADVSPQALLDAGIRGVILDLDNTLVPWSSDRLSAVEREWVARCLASGLRLCIVSNTRRPSRLKALSQELGIPCVRAGKPRRRGFRQAMLLLDASPATTAVIGDQLLTDILGGNRLGLYTILVRRLSHREFIGTRLSRLAEHAIFSYLQRHGHRPWE
jgi:HAD superfamily phosphatase (TIGR01668 family)